MLTADTASRFAREWIAAWNNHQPDEILAHYEDDLEFHSPLVIALKFNSEGVIRNKAELRKYFEIGLQAFPDLHFELRHCFAGINSLVIYYLSVNRKLAAEVFELSNNRKARRVLCLYGI